MPRYTEFPFHLESARRAPEAGNQTSSRGSTRFVSIPTFNAADRSPQRATFPEKLFIPRPRTSPRALPPFPILRHQRDAQIALVDTRDTRSRVHTARVLCITARACAFTRCIRTRVRLVADRSCEQREGARPRGAT